MKELSVAALAIFIAFSSLFYRARHIGFGDYPDQLSVGQAKDLDQALTQVSQQLQKSSAR